MSTKDRRDRRVFSGKRYGGILVALVVVVILLGEAFLIGAYYRSRQAKYTEQVSASFATQGFLPIRAAMEVAGWQEEGAEYTFIMPDAPGVQLHFDMEQGIATKGERYTFDAHDQIFWYGEEMWGHETLLTTLLPGHFTYENGKLNFEPAQATALGWENSHRLIAHAGGGLRTREESYMYQNTLEALVQNYELGHRLFEFDFMLTSDDQLAIVHDGYVEENDEHIRMTADEWKMYDGFHTTTLLLQDLLEQMVLNPDMMIVTDSKFTSMLPLEVLVQEVQEFDPQLLDRFIPQIYAIEMYEPLMKLYEFPSVIYTVYQAVDDWNDVLVWAQDAQAVSVITMPLYRAEQGWAAAAVEKGFTVYAHTLNTAREMVEYVDYGVYGFYTDFITPDQLKEYKLEE